MTDNILLNNSKKVKRFFELLIKLGYDTKFTQRKSKLDSQTFIKTIVQTHFQNEKPALEDYSETFELITKERISKQAIDQRINKNTIDFLKEALRHLMMLNTNDYKIPPKLLSYFSSVNALDSTSVELNEGLKEHFRGSGGCASKAAVKMQHLYDPINKKSKFFELTESTFSDNKYIGFCDKMLDCIKKESLLLFDLGYFGANFLSELIDRSIYFLSRFPHGSVNVYLKSNPNEKIDIVELLSKCKNENIFELDVLITEKKIPCRLICTRVKQEIASLRIYKKKKELQKKNRMITKGMTILLEWSIILTNVPEEIIKPKDAYKIYGLRWSIELFFKVLKSGLSFDYIAGMTNEFRVMFEIYGKLISLVLLTTFNNVVISELPLTAEISLPRTLSCFRKMVVEVLSNVLFVRKLVKIWELYITKVRRKCLVSRSGKRKSTLNSLDYHCKGGYHVTHKMELFLEEIMA